MTPELANWVQDDYGRYCRAGECVEMIGQVRELGTDRTLFRVVWADGGKESRRLRT
jgi:hypothetical protein